MEAGSSRLVQARPGLSQCVPARPGSSRLMGAWAGPPGKVPLKDCQIFKSYRVFEKRLFFFYLSSLSPGLTRSADAIAISALKILMNPPDLKIEVSRMVEMLKVKTTLRTMCSIMFCLNQHVIMQIKAYHIGITGYNIMSLFCNIL